MGPTKLLLLLMSSRDLVLAWRPARRVAERVLGKMGHAFEFHPPLRSVLQETHSEIQTARDQQAARITFSAEAVAELIAGALLALLAKFDLGAE